MEYRKHFEEALVRTRDLGLSEHYFTIKEKVTYIDEQFLGGGLVELMAGIFYDLTPEQVSAKCVPIHFHLLKAVKQYFGCNAILTIGEVSEGEHSYYSLSEESIAELLSQGLNSSFPFHCWITLDSLEIIDVTLATTMSVAQRKPEFLGQALAIHSSEMKSRGITVSYKPMLVEENFLSAIGIDPLTGVAIAYSPQGHRNNSLYKKITRRLRWILNALRLQFKN